MREDLSRAHKHQAMAKLHKDGELGALEGRNCSSVAPLQH